MLEYLLIVPHFSRCILQWTRHIPTWHAVTQSPGLVSALLPMHLVKCLHFLSPRGSLHLPAAWSCSQHPLKVRLTQTSLRCCQLSSPYLLLWQHASCLPPDSPPPPLFPMEHSKAPWLFSLDVSCSASPWMPVPSGFWAVPTAHSFSSLAFCGWFYSLTYFSFLP